MPKVFHKKIDAHSQLAIWEITESAEELKDLLQLSEAETAFAESLSGKFRLKHWLSSRALLRELLQTERFIHMESDGNGKPFLVDIEKEISMSHSGYYAAVMVGNSSCGIDIERLRPGKIEKLIGKFIHPDDIRQLPKDNREVACFLHWCVKEAVYKKHGKLKLNFKNDIRLMQSKEVGKEGSGQVKVHLGNAQEVQYPFHYFTFRDYLLAYVS